MIGRFDERGGRRALRRPRLLGPLAALLLVAVTLAGCATKRDVRDLRTDMDNLRARQDTIFLLLTGQNRAVRDSVFEVLNEVIRTRGDLKNDIGRLERQLIQIQQLVGQTQRSIAEQREDLERRLGESERLRARGPAGDTLAAGEPGQVPRGIEGGTGTPAEELYQLGSENLERGASATARIAFEQLLVEHPNDARAPDAQFMIGETYYADSLYDEAIRAMETVVERYPNSPRAPEALYRAGIIAEERGNFEAARGYFRRVMAGYSRSDVARLADQALSRLPNR